MKSIKAECGHRARESDIQDGKCRECRGESLKKVNTRNKWNASGEQLAMIEAHNRQRIIQNDRNL